MSGDEIGWAASLWKCLDGKGMIYRIHTRIRIFKLAFIYAFGGTLRCGIDTVDFHAILS